jgi:DNA-nicking Smr family endonuclease
MARRKRERDLPDWHLWREVTRTVTPLRPGEAPPAFEEPLTASLPLPLPPSPLSKPKPEPFFIPMPSYRPGGAPAPRPQHDIEPRLKQRLQRGHIDIDGTIDLHGMRQSEAHEALKRYVTARWTRGDRTLLVITGKGLKKTGPDAAVIIERGVLRAMLPVWLSEPPLSGLVAGWDNAAQGHGGQGAFYVRLRRERDY